MSPLSAPSLRPLPGLALVVGMAVACGAPPPSPTAVAKVGDYDVEAATFRSYLQRTVGKDGEQLGSDVLSKLFDRLLEEVLLFRLAVDRGVAQEEDSRRRAVDQLLAAEAPPRPSSEDVRRYYRQHPGEFQRTERVWLRQILTDDLESARRAQEELAAGADFVAVARRHSRDPSAAGGGDQGELGREDLPEPFAGVIFSLAPGEISEPVEADYGVHLFQVVERLPAAQVPLEQAEEEIRRRLRREAVDALLDGLVEEARSRYNVTVYEKNLAFSYQGIHRGEQRENPTQR